MDKRLSRMAVCLAGLLLLVACESVPTGHTYCTVQNVPSGKGVVYLFRPSLPYEYGVVFDVTANGAPLIGLGDGTYYPYVSDPGMVTFASDRSGEKTATLQMRVDAGQSYYVKLVPVKGVFRMAPELSQLHQDAALPLITGCKIVLK